MPRIIKTTVYKFEELSDKAKEKARDWYREASAGDTYFSEAVIEDAVTIAELFGLTIDSHTYKTHGGYETKDGETTWSRNIERQHTRPDVDWSGFSSQGDGASFQGRYEYKPGGLAAVMDHAPQDKELHDIVAVLEDSGPKIGFDITTSGNYSHSGCMSFELRDTDFQGNEIKDLDEVSEDTIKEAQEALRAFADWIYSNLEKEYEYVNSDETIDETMDANDYEFTKNGERA